MGKESRIVLLRTVKGSADSLPWIPWTRHPTAFLPISSKVWKLHWLHLHQPQQHLNSNCCSAVFLWKGGCGTNKARRVREGTAAETCSQLEMCMLSSPQQRQGLQLQTANLWNFSGSSLKVHFGFTS